MRARPNLSGEQIVIDYLTRVAQAARYLPKGARAAFVGRTRSLVEREVGPPGTRTDPERVIEALTKLGKPEDLVLEERTRIDRGWVKKREGDEAAAALSGPRNRSLPSRRRPNSGTRPWYGKDAQIGPDGTVIGPDGTVMPAGTVIGPDGTVTGPAGPDAGTGPRRSVLRGASPRGASPRGGGARETGSRAAGPRAIGPRAVGPRDAGPGTAASRTGAPRRLRSADSLEDGKPRTASAAGTDAPAGPESARRSGPLDWLTGQGPRSGAAGTENLTASAGRLARDNVLETVAILFLGLGGLILPFPFWPLGAVVSMFSRLWDIKDKSLAVAGPLLVVLVASVITALFVGGGGNAVLIYFHAVHVGFGLLIRVGSALTAVYLAWRVSKGPRVKTPPWQRVIRGR
jgi:hypothetical protein